MSVKDTYLTQPGHVVQELLDRVDGLSTATQEEDGLMSKRDKARLDDDVADTPLTNLEIEAILNT